MNEQSNVTSRLEFLDLLEADLRRAAGLFAVWANQQLQAHRFPILRSLSVEDQKDCRQEILLHFIKNNARVLVSYRQQTAKFETWFSVVAGHKAIDWLRARAGGIDIPIEEEPEEGIRTITLPTPTPNAQAAMEWREAVKNTKKAYRLLESRCRLLLRLASKGYPPREMIKFFPHLGLTNVQAGNALSYCRGQIRQKLTELGVNIDDYFAAE